MLTALLTAAFAGDLTPLERPPPVLAVAGDGRGLYYPLPERGALCYEVEGPGLLSLELRRRGGELGDASVVRALADEVPLAQIAVTEPIDPEGWLLDGGGDKPSAATRVAVQVPAGAHQLTLIAPGNTSTTLVAVSETSAAAAPLAADGAIDSRQLQLVAADGDRGQGAGRAASAPH